jgi:hypothetical protein
VYEEAVERAAVLILLLAASACSGGGAVSSPTPAAVGVSRESGRVDVGGYELAYECRGAGSPIIVLEAGYDSAGITTFTTIMDDLAETSRVCAYDRAGTGSSDPRPAATDLTSGDQADELRALLAGAGVEPPYVLVAHSYGGFVSRLFASRYPGETAGLVLIESSHEDEIAAYRRFYGGSSDSDWVDGGDLLDIQATAAMLQDSARNYGDLPLVAIRAERYEDVLAESLWVRTQADLATLSSRGLQVVALDSGHLVMDDNASVVIAAVDAVVEASRSGEPLAPCEELFADLEADCPT